MASTFTPNLNLEKPAFRDYIDAWHTVLNANFDKVDENVSRITDINSRFLFVDPKRTDIYTPNGTRAKPYKLIQNAINFIESNWSPSHDNPAQVLIMPGIHTESLIIKKSGVHLQGLGMCRIRTDSGTNTRPALTISNATISSLNSFFANDGRNDPSGAYTNLITDISLPEEITINNIEFGDPDISGVNDIMILGSGNGEDFLDKYATFLGIICYGNFFIRNTNYVRIKSSSWIKGNLITFNIAGSWLEYTVISGTVSVSYNVASSQPSDISNNGLCGGPLKIMGSLEVFGAGRVGFDNLVNTFINGNITLSDSANCKINSGYINGDINAEGATTFTFRNVFIEGSMNLSNIEGTTPCIFDGGQIITDINDDSSRLIWHDYNPANAADWFGGPPNTIKDAIDRLASKVAEEHGAV